MKRKPDMLWWLAIVFGLAVVTTGYTEVQWERKAAIQSNAVHADYQSKG